MGYTVGTCRFAVDLLAPQGLSGIRLFGCLLPLEAWQSNYNGQVILRLRNDAPETIEWEMDPSNTPTMFASGFIAAAPPRAQELLESLSACLATAGFPHRIRLDDNEERLFRTIEFEWPKSAL